MDVFLETPPLRNVTHFFDFAKVLVALFILQVLRLSVLYKSIKYTWGKART